MEISNDKLNFLITGSSGFIGCSLALRLIKDGHNVIGIDNLSDSKIKKLQEARLFKINNYQGLGKGKWQFYNLSIENELSIREIFEKNQIEVVINLAAKAGVRDSIKYPKSYINTNICGFGNILEICKDFQVKHLIYASSSSVYGGNKKVPFSEEHFVDHPVSLYAATKKTNELMAYTYSHLYNLPTTGLRFFTVYGPLGRPDMAPMIFADCITQNKPVPIFNFGKMKRDFTYIDDVVEGIVRCIFNPIEPNSLTEKLSKLNPKGSAPYRVFNIGYGEAVDLLYFIELLEKYFDKRALKEFMPMQKGDVEITYADTSELNLVSGFIPSINIEEGVKLFVEWYKDFYL